MTTSTVHLYSNHISLNGTTDTPSTEIKAKGLHMTYCIKEKKKLLVYHSLKVYPFLRFWQSCNWLMLQWPMGL